MPYCNLPYVAEEASLPASVPTEQEIESATEILSVTTGRKVVIVGDHFVVKYGVRVDLLEGERMLFLTQSTNILVPRIYAMFQSWEEGKHNPKSYIFMERIRGCGLDSAWPKMDEQQKEAVSLKLRDIFEEMRKLESPGGYCSVGHCGLPDDLFWTDDPSQPYAGPFDTEADLNNAILMKYVEDGLSKHKADYYSRVFKNLFQNHGPVFSHADVQRKNIMIRNFPSEGKKEAQWDPANVDVVLIGWKFAGWYPSYWEYVRAIFACGRWEDDWNYWIEKALEPSWNEYA
jgi:hypothetical protein